jgi:hypothetical protein
MWPVRVAVVLVLAACVTLLGVAAQVHAHPAKDSLDNARCLRCDLSHHSISIFLSPPVVAPLRAPTTVALLPEEQPPADTVLGPASPRAPPSR